MPHRRVTSPHEKLWSYWLYCEVKSSNRITNLIRCVAANALWTAAWAARRYRTRERLATVLLPVVIVSVGAGVFAVSSLIPAVLPEGFLTAAFGRRSSDRVVRSESRQTPRWQV